MLSKTIFKAGISNLSEIELARINELVSNSNGTTVCTSYDVSKVFGKEHNKVCDIIKKSIQRIGECMEQMSSSQKMRGIQHKISISDLKNVILSIRMDVEALKYAKGLS